MRLNSMKSNIWFFGDSYLEHDANWVRFVADRCKAKIQELGAGGSSVSYLLDRLHKCAPRIKKDDYVVVSLSDPYRHYFDDLHLMPHMVRTPDMDHIDLNPYGMIENEYRRKLGIEKNRWKKLRTIPIQMHTLDILNAYNNYMSHLYTPTVFSQELISIVNNIIKNILPNLPTKKVIYFYSIDREAYEDTLFFQKGSQPTVTSFFHQQVDYFAQEKDMTDHSSIMPELETPNHWVTDPKMQKRFWTINNPILKLIGADNPDLII